MAAALLRLKTMKGRQVSRSHQARGWRPTTLRPRYMVSLACAMLVMLLVIEALRLWSNSRGGLFVFNSSDDMSDAQYFAYNYVPILFAVLIGIFWSFTEYDALRLEPYFQLLRPEGMSADVLLINYVFGHFTTTPFNAARNRHWIALFVSILGISLQLILPPVQSSLLRLDDVTIPLRETIRIWPDLVGLKVQEFLFYSNDSDWNSAGVGKGLALYSTRSTKYALPPVEINWDNKFETNKWILDQSVYWTELLCADVHPTGALSINPLLDSHIMPSINQSLLWNMSGIGALSTPSAVKDACTLTLNHSIPVSSMDKSLQALHWEPRISNSESKSGQIETWINSEQCDSYDLFGVVASINSTDTSMHIKSRGSSYSHEVAAFACNVSYKTAMAEVSLHGNGSVAKVDLHRDSIKEMSPTMFDRSRFNDALLQKAMSTSNTFDLNNSNGPTSGFKYEFISKIDLIIKQSFVRMISRAFDVGGRTTHVEGIRETHQMALIVDPTHSLFSEMILAFGVIVVSCLAYIYPRRSNMLHSNPASIASMCAITTDLLDDASFRKLSELQLDNISARNLRLILRNFRCQWREKETKYGGELEIDTRNALGSEIKQGIKARPSPPPHFLMLQVFPLELLGFLGIITGIGIIFAFSLKNGYFESLLDIKSGDLTILFTLIPSALASLTKGIFISIYQNLSVLEPWFRLQKGSASADSSLLLDYGSQSPFLIMFQFLKRRRLLVGLVAITCILNIVLSVVASGLFILELEPRATGADVKSDYDHQFFTASNHSSVLSELDLIQSSIHAGSSMFAWTAQNYSFLPARLDNNDEVVGGSLLGIGANLVCRQLSVSDSLMQEADSGTTYWQYSLFDDSTTTCRIPAARSACIYDDDLTVKFLISSGSEQDTRCWKQTGLVVASSSCADNGKPTPGNTVALHCEPRISMQNFTTGFDCDGAIQYFIPMSNSSITDGSMWQNATSSLASYNKIVAGFSHTSSNASNQTSPLTNWFGALSARIYQQYDIDSTAIDPDILLSASQSVYQTAFAIDLSLQRDNHFQRLPAPAPINDGMKFYWAWSVVPSLPCFIIALLITLFDTGVLLAVFSTRRAWFKFPRIPRSIGSMIPWITQSKMLKDLEGTSTWSDAERHEYLMKLNKRYSLSRSKTEDGGWRYVLDEEPPA